MHNALRHQNKRHRHHSQHQPLHAFINLLQPQVAAKQRRERIMHWRYVLLNFLLPLARWFKHFAHMQAQALQHALALP